MFPTRRASSRAALIALCTAFTCSTGCRRTAAVEVELEAAARRPVFRSTVSASGEIVAVRYADIGSSVMGKLVELPVAEGDHVRAGQVVARVDRVPAASEAAATEAQLRAAEADAAAARSREQDAARALKRGRELHAQGLLPQADFDALSAAASTATAQAEAAEKRIVQARALLTRARDLLGKTDIVSPMDGVVTRLPVRAGEMVVIGIQNMPGTTLMTISDLAEVNAEVKVPEADILRVRRGQPATVTLEALSGRRFEGEVVEVGASALPVTGAGAAAREFKVKVRVRGGTDGLRPGLTCDTEILVGESKGALTVPLQSVVLRGAADAEQTGIFTVEGDVARFVRVEAGMIGGLEIEVKGLAEGRQVIAGPWQALKDLQDGAKVKPRPKD